MTKPNYELQNRDDGWVYVIDGRRSPFYSTREAAIKAAEGESVPRTFDEELDDELDDGLEDTFPASDPVSVTRRDHTGGPDRTK